MEKNTKFWVRKLEIMPKIVGHDINYYYRACHDHNFYEFMVIVKGKSIHYVNDDVQILSTGNLVFVRPSDLRYLMPYSDVSSACSMRWSLERNEIICIIRCLRTCALFWPTGKMKWRFSHRSGLRKLYDDWF